MSDFIVPAIEGLGVDAVDVTHQQGEIGLPGVQHEVVVVAHQAIGQGFGVEAGQRLRHDLQQAVAILAIGKDVFAPVTTRGDVIHRAGKFDTQRTGHARTLRQEEAKGTA